MGSANARTNKNVQEIDGIRGSQVISITQGGYLPFQYGPTSDHRILWIKIQH